MELAARVFFSAFGVFAIVGGVIGFVKARSKPSLIAGSASGALLLLAAGLIGSVWGRAGLVIALTLSVLLAGRFVPAYMKTRKTIPAGVMAALSCVGVVVTIATWLAP